MIGQLRGILRAKKNPYLLIDCQGVCYEVEATLSVFETLPALDAPITIYTHFLVREDVQALFGFVDEAERDTFRTLIKLNGVGAKMALTILSGMNARVLAEVIQQDNIKALTALPGVGAKTAQRLLLELKDKLKPSQATQDEAKLMPSTTTTLPVADEAVAALIALGYKSSEALLMIEKASQTLDVDSLDDSAVLIRHALSQKLKKA